MKNPTHRSLKNFLARSLHQSFFLIALAVGVIAGTILGLVFHINYFASPIWLVLVIILFIFTYFQPKYIFLSLALTAGLLLAFFRVASALEIQAQQKAQQKTQPTNPAQTRQAETADSRESWLLSARDWLASRIHAELDPRETTAATTNGSTNETNPTAGLGLSYLLGQKSDLDKTTYENLKTIGLVHIVVASGTHLSILVGFISSIFRKISRRVSLVFSILFVIIFMTLIGFTPSILRAGLMTILALIAGYSGRRIAPWRLILLIAAATLIIDPTFITDLGWLLSFASYAGIMVLGPSLTKFFYDDEAIIPRDDSQSLNQIQNGIHFRFGFRASSFSLGLFLSKKKPSLVITSISATLLTLPITLYYFGQFSLISIFANLLILPTLPFALALTLATGLLSGLPLISPLVTTITDRLLTLHLTVIDFLADQPSFLITIDRYQPAVFLLYIPLIAPFIIGLIRRKVLKLNKVDKGRTKICQDTVNGKPPNAKKPSLTRNAAPSSRK